MITYKASETISADSVHHLFTNNELNNWFSLSDTEHYIQNALAVFSAWDGQRCVGLAVLCGDGRITVELDLLLVDASYRQREIGTSLMTSAVEKVNELQPYHFKVEVFEQSTESFYARFGFVRNEGTWLLEHTVVGNRLRNESDKARSNRSCAGP